jgi:hypothetical protein
MDRGRKDYENIKVGILVATFVALAVAIVLSGSLELLNS